MGFEYTKIKRKNDKPYFLMTVVADWNDGDYITETHQMDEKEMKDWGMAAYSVLFDATNEHSLEKLSEKWYLYNGKTGELKREIDVPVDEPGWYDLNELIPYETCSGVPCHTIKTLKLEYYDIDGTIYDVSIKKTED